MARRLSARFVALVAPKHKKKDGAVTPKEEETVKETEAVSDEAPKLDEPAATEPLKMEEVSSSVSPIVLVPDDTDFQTKSTAPAAAPIVSTTA